MNRLNFWSRSSSKSRTADAKAEAEASEQKDDQDKKSKKHTRVETKNDEPLEVVVPQEDVGKETAKDRAGVEEQAKLQPIAPQETTALEDKVDGEEEKLTEDIPVAVATKDEQAPVQAPEIPGGAPTSAPHTEEDKTATSTDEKKEEDSEQITGGASKDAPLTDEEESTAKGTAAEDTKTEELPGGASTTAPHTEQESEDSATANTDEQAATGTKQEANDSSEEAQTSDDREGTDPASIQLPMKEEDEEFFNKMTTEDEPQQPPSMSRRPTEIGDNGELHEPEDIPLPMSPGNEEGNPLEAKKDQTPATWKDRWNQWSFVPAAPSTSYFRRAPKEDKKTAEETDGKKDEKSPGKSADDNTDAELNKKKDETTDEKTSAADEEAVANAAKATDLTAKDTKSTTDTKRAEVQQHRDLSHMLSNLKLSSLNNSVMGISHETQHLLESFTVTLKDVVNGAPTAYEDLDKLLNERGEQLDNLFGTMPPFVQTLVKSLPVKMYGAMAPSVAAAMSSEKGSDVDFHAAEAGTDDEAEVTVDVGSSDPKEKKKKRGLVPSVQSLVKEQGTVAAMLRSILNFLQARFPMFITGTNVLMSVSVFILLFVFWYCHKRGKQVRLSKQAANKTAAEASLDDLERQVRDEKLKVEEMQEEAVDVPLPEAKDSELVEESSSKDTAPTDGPEATQADAQEAETSNKNDTNTKDSESPPSSESLNAEQKPKDINQTIAETFMGAKPSSSSSGAPTAEKTKSDEETQHKLAALQQKAVDEAPAEHSSTPHKSKDNDEEDTNEAETPKPAAAAPTAAKDSAAPSPVEEKSDVAPAVEDKHEGKAEDKHEEKQEQTKGGAQHTIDDLMKALESHAKESGKSGKNDDKAKENAKTVSKKKKKEEEVVDDPNEEMMSY